MLQETLRLLLPYILSMGFVEEFVALYIYVVL